MLSLFYTLDTHLWGECPFQIMRSAYVQIIPVNQKVGLHTALNIPIVLVFFFFFCLNDVCESGGPGYGHLRYTSLAVNTEATTTCCLDLLFVRDSQSEVGSKQQQACRSGGHT